MFHFSQGDMSYLICTLQKGKVYQSKLDLNFMEGDKVTFSTKGNGIVHLSGFLVPDEDEFGDMDMDDEEDESMDEEQVWVFKMSEAFLNCLTNWHSPRDFSADLRQKLEKTSKKSKPVKEEANGKKKPAKKVESEDEEDEDDSDAELDESGLAEVSFNATNNEIIT